METGTVKIPPPPKPEREIVAPQNLRAIGALILAFFGIGGIMWSLTGRYQVSSFQIMESSGRLYGPTHIYTTVGSSLLFSCLWIVASYGIINSKKWARKFTIWLSAAVIIYNIAFDFYLFLGPLPRAIFTGMPFFLTGLIIIQVFILWYFTSVDVKAYYKHLGES